MQAIPITLHKRPVNSLNCTPIYLQPTYFSYPKVSLCTFWLAFDYSLKTWICFLHASHMAHIVCHFVHTQIKGSGFLRMVLNSSIWLILQIWIDFTQQTLRIIQLLSQQVICLFEFFILSKQVATLSPFCKFLFSGALLCSWNSWQDTCSKTLHPSDWSSTVSELAKLESRWWLQVCQFHQ